MREVHVISLIALCYAVVLSLVTFLFFRDYLLYAVLGAAVALFNHSQMIQLTKREVKTERIVLHIVQRYIFYLVIIVFVYFDTRDQIQSFMTNSFIFLLLGIASIKIGVYIYHTPLIKKKKEEVIEKADEDHESLG